MDNNNNNDDDDDEKDTTTTSRLAGLGACIRLQNRVKEGGEQLGE